MIYQRHEFETLHNSVNEFLKSKKGTTIILKGELGNGKSRIVQEVLNVPSLVPNIHIGDKFIRSIISVKYDVDELFHGEDLSLNVWKNIIKDIETNFCINSINEGRGFEKKEYINIVHKVISDVGFDWLKLIPVLGDISATGFKTINNAYKIIKEKKDFKKKEQHSMFSNNMIDTFDQLKAYLLRISSEIPTIISIKNIQWADETSLEFLCYLCTYIKKFEPSILLILIWSHKDLLGNKIASKNNFTERLVYLDKYNLLEYIHVSNLSTDQIKLYLSSLNLSLHKDDEFCKKLYELTNGNIFFMNIILQNISDKDVINAQSLDSLPGSLLGIIEDYLKILSSDAKDVLISCAVMGETFSMDIIEKLFELNRNKMERIIQELVDNSIIFSSRQKLGNLKKVYQFTQSSVRRYIYISYDENLKLQKHKQIADLLINESNIQILNMHLYHWGIGNNIINESNEIIISRQSLQDEEVLEITKIYLRQIVTLSDKYKTQFIYDEALKLFSKIIHISDLLNDYSSLSEHIINKAKILKTMGKYNEALEVLNIFIEKSAYLDIETIARIDLERGDIYESNDKDHQALKFYESVEKTCEKNNFNDWLIVVYGKIGVIYYKKHDFEQALFFYDKKIQLCKLRNLSVEEHRVYHEIANIHLQRKEFEEAELLYQKNYKFFSDGYYLRDKMLSIGNLGIVYKEKKLYQKALKCQNEKLELSLKLLDKREEMRAYGNIGNVYCEMQDLKMAIDNYEKTFKLATDLNDLSGIAGASGQMGVIFHEMNQHQLAKEKFLKAIEVSKEAGNKLYQLQFLEYYIDLLKQLNEGNDIQDLIKQGLEIANEISNKEFIENHQPS